jgi:hypothetical protein
MPGAPASFELPSSALLGDVQAGFSRRVYFECAPRLAGDADRWLVSHAGESGQTSVAASAESVMGWVNPVVLQVQLAGNVFEQAPPGAADTDPRAVLQRELLAKFDVFAVFPLLPSEHDARLIAWEKLISAQPASAKPNAVERLVLGADTNQSPRAMPLLPRLAAFFCLDQLGGVFAVHGHGAAHPPAGTFRPAELSYSWWPPSSGLTPNEEWFASYAERCWATGRRMDEPEQAPNAGVAARVATAPYRFVVGAGKATLQRPAAFEEPASRLSAARQRWEVLTLDDAALLASTPPDPDGDDDAREPLRPDQHWDERRWVLSCLPRVNRDPQQRDFFVQLFADPRLERHSLWMTVRRATRDPVKQGEQWVCEHNFEQLQEALGRDFIAPVSPVRFEIPIGLAAESEQGSRPDTQRYFDLMRSLNDGGIGLLTGLLQPHRRETNARNRERLQLEPSAGWWNDWHLCLFGDPAELQLEFLASGLTLGVSRLGEVPLGGSTTVAAIPSVMSFTRPAPREVSGAH